jgi:phosphatidylglycerol---prolipoprotein diacylglyceryl transferase
MKPIPVAFHIGPLEIHTYGIGLAVTFWFAYRYFDRRLRQHGYSTEWLPGVFLWVIVTAVVGARSLNVLSNLGYYSHNPGDVFAIWHGGLSSFGGLLFAVPTGIHLVRRRCPELRMARGLDLVAPVLASAWAMGRLLGPQLMVAGGGHRTTQWFGMYYATQFGRRLPVPIFQALEDFTIFLVLIYLERRLDRWPEGSPRVGYPSGVVIGTGMVLWGIERATDQRLWLSYPNNLGSVLVQLAGVGLTVSGLVVLVLARHHWRTWRLAGAPGGRLPPPKQGDLESRGDDGRQAATSDTQTVPAADLDAGVGSDTASRRPVPLRIASREQGPIASSDGA